MAYEPVNFPDKVREAYGRIQADIRRTPLEYSEPLSRETGARVYVKWECDQITGSFKLRGALNKLRSLSDADRGRGVVSASTGNHGLAISHASRLEGVGLKLFLPVTAAEVKRKKIEALGVDVEVRERAATKPNRSPGNSPDRPDGSSFHPITTGTSSSAPERSGLSSPTTSPVSKTSSSPSEAAGSSPG